MWGAAILAGVCLSALPAIAQVVFDGSLGPAGAAPTRSDLPGFEIDHLIRYDEAVPIESRHGTVVGGNLFQSLSELSVLRPTGGCAAPGVDLCTSVTFQALDASGNPIALDNVIARITGGTPSLIQGVLRSEVPGAELYLLNPSGILFQGAGPLENQLDVPAGVHLSTADGLRFSDGTLLAVDASTPPALSSADPAAFGFLGGNDAVVALEASRIGAPGGETITIIAGSVSLELESLIGHESPGGVIQVAAVGNAALEVPVDVAGFAASGAPAGLLGSITLVEDSDFRSTGGSTSPQGRIVLRGGELVVDDSLVAAGGNTGPTGVAIDVEMADLVLVRNRAQILSGGNPVVGTGSGQIVTRRLEVRDPFSVVGVRAAGSGPDTADFRVVADEILVTDGGLLTTSNLQSTPGGDLILEAGTIEVRDGGAIRGLTRLGSAPGGDLILRTDDLLVTRISDAVDAGRIETLTQGSGTAGDLSIEPLGAAATAQVTLEQGGQLLAEAGSTAPGGSLSIQSDALEIRSGSQVRTTSEADQAAGPLSVEVTGDVAIVGDGPDPAQPSGIFARTRDAPGAGLLLSAGSLTLSGNAFVSTTSTGSGAAGALTLGSDEAPLERVRLEGNANGTPEIASRSQDGGGGALTLRAGSLELVGGGALAASTFGAGAAGAIDVVADRLLLSGRDASGDESAILSETVSPDLDAGDGGDIRITVASDVQLLAGGLVSARSQGPGDAGDIAITAGGDIRLDKGSVVTESPGSAGGNIAIASGTRVELVESRVTTSVLGRQGEGDAGNVQVEAPYVVLNASSVLATAILGDGGDIQITSGAFLESTDSEVNASSDLGIDGAIAKPAPDTTLIGGLARLPAGFLDATALLRQHCAARAAGSGSFVVTGRDGPAESPERPLPARMPLPELAGGATPRDGDTAANLGRSRVIDCAAFEAAARENGSP